MGRACNEKRLYQYFSSILIFFGLSTQRDERLRLWSLKLAIFRRWNGRTWPLVSLNRRPYDCSKPFSHWLLLSGSWSSCTVWRRYRSQCSHRKRWNFLSSSKAGRWRLTIHLGSHAVQYVVCQTVQTSSSSRSRATRGLLRTSPSSRANRFSLFSSIDNPVSSPAFFSDFRIVGSGPNLAGSYPPKTQEPRGRGWPRVELDWSGLDLGNLLYFSITSLSGVVLILNFSRSTPVLSYY